MGIHNKKEALDLLLGGKMRHLTVYYKKIGKIQTLLYTENNDQLRLSRTCTERKHRPTKFSLRKRLLCR